jgi:hypothetical protein
LQIYASSPLHMLSVKSCVHMSPRRAQFKNEPAHAMPAFIGSLENTFEVHCEAPEPRTISLCRGHFDQLRGLLIHRSTLAVFSDPCFANAASCTRCDRVWSRIPQALAICTQVIFLTVQRNPYPVFTNCFLGLVGHVLHTDRWLRCLRRAAPILPFHRHSPSCQPYLPPARQPRKCGPDLPAARQLRECGPADLIQNQEKNERQPKLPAVIFACLLCHAGPVKHVGLRHCCPRRRAVCYWRSKYLRNTA